nr:vegetative cell wall protein gp1-like [Aegilops tauschii subsp. strangulata]
MDLDHAPARPDPAASSQRPVAGVARLRRRLPISSPRRTSSTSSPTASPSHAAPRHRSPSLVPPRRSHPAGSPLAFPSPGRLRPPPQPPLPRHHGPVVRPRHLLLLPCSQRHPAPDAASVGVLAAPAHTRPLLDAPGARPATSARTSRSPCSPLRCCAPLLPAALDRRCPRFFLPAQTSFKYELDLDQSNSIDFTSKLTQLIHPQSEHLLLIP